MRDTPMVIHRMRAEVTSCTCPAATFVSCYLEGTAGSRHRGNCRALTTSSSIDLLGATHFVVACVFLMTSCDKGTRVTSALGSLLLLVGTSSFETVVQLEMCCGRAMTVVYGAASVRVPHIHTSTFYVNSEDNN